MSLLTQIVFIFATMLLFAVLQAVLNKKNRVAWIISAVMLIPIAATTYFGLNIFQAAQTDTYENSLIAKADENNYIVMADALIEKGLTKSADELLDEYASVYPVNDSYMHARARLEAIRGNYSEAKGIYNYLINDRNYDSDSAEDEYACLQDVVAGKVAYERFVSEVKSAVDKMDIPENVTEAASVFATVDSLDDSSSASDAKKATEQYEQIITEDPSIMYPSVMEENYLKALVIAGEYETVIVRSENYTTANEFLVLSELCRTGEITKSDIRKAKKEKNKNAAVIKWIESQKSGIKDPEGVIKSALDKLNSYETKSLEGYEKWVRAKIDIIIENENEPEISKLYLELARVEFDNGDEKAATLYIKKALITASNSDDSSYSCPVNELNKILENKEDTEALKDIDEYVDMMVDNMGSASMKAGAGSDSAVDSQFKDDVSDTIKEENDIAPDDGNPVKSEGDEFSDYVNTQVNQITLSINITSVDTEKFEEVSTVISVDDAIASTTEEFKKNIEILDCDAVISDYKVEKLPDIGVNIMLVCDNSGSMGDPSGSTGNSKIYDLKNALQLFVSKLNADVEVGIISFDSGIYQDRSAELGSSINELKSAIDKMTDSGGTNIYGGIDEALNKMGARNAMNIVVVLSDGQENSSPSSDEYKSIRQRCSDNGISLYTMGLGDDVDSKTLSYYADLGGGSYSFVSDSDTLLSFYEYILKISRNRFKVTYNAINTVKVSRKVRATYLSDVKVFDEHKYSLESDLDETDLGDDYWLTREGMDIGGLDTRLLRKSSVDQVVHLLGRDLKKDLDISISIRAGTSYDLECEYESDTSWKVTVPASVSCGEYDVIVTVNGMRAVFDSGLVITNDNMRIVRFGQYVFEATGVGELKNATVLSGYVRMNGWLGFVGDVKLTGNVATDDKVVLDSQRAYVQYYKGEKQLNLFAQLMADAGHTIPVNYLKDLELYRNENISPSSDDFSVGEVVAPYGIVIQNLFELNAPSIKLYPDRFEVDFQGFNTKFPFQDKLLKEGGLDNLFEFSAEHSEVLIISQYAVDCDIEVSVKSSDQDEFRQAHFGNMPLYINLNDLNLKINTKDGDFSFKIAVNVAMLSDGLGFELKWKGFNFDTAKLYCDYDVNTQISGIPITFSDFSLGAEGLSNGFKGLTLVGGCKISAAKISAVAPELEKYLGDLSILSLDDVELKLRFYNPYISVSANAKFLEKVEIGHASIQLGMKIPYTNNLLGYNDELVDGFIGSVGVGIKMETSNADIDVGGSLEIGLTDYVLGLTAEGHANIEVKWWIFSKNIEKDGRVFFGFYKKHNDNTCFALLLQNDKGKITRIEMDQ